MSNKILYPSAVVLSLMLLACGGGGDAASSAETPSPTPTPAGTPAPTPTPTPTPAPAPAPAPLTGYGLITNPAGGDYGNQCAIDHATGLIWEGKNPNPAHPQGTGRTYTNFDNTVTPQVRYSTPTCPACSREPTNGEILAGSNSIGYSKVMRYPGLCGFTDWRLPTAAELLTLGKISTKLSGFPETVSNTYWSSDIGTRDDYGIIVDVNSNTSRREYRGDAFGLRLVRSNR